MKDLSDSPTLDAFHSDLWKIIDRDIGLWPNGSAQAVSTANSLYLGQLLKNLKASVDAQSGASSTEINQLNVSVGNNTTAIASLETAINNQTTAINNLTAAIVALDLL